MDSTILSLLANDATAARKAKSKPASREETVTLKDRLWALKAIQMLRLQNTVMEIMKQYSDRNSSIKKNLASRQGLNGGAATICSQTQAVVGGR